MEATTDISNSGSYESIQADNSIIDSIENHGLIKQSTYNDAPVKFSMEKNGVLYTLSVQNAPVGV